MRNPITFIEWSDLPCTKKLHTYPSKYKAKTKNRVERKLEAFYAIFIFTMKGCRN